MYNLVVNDYDRSVYENELKNFLPETFIDLHTHISLNTFTPQGDSNGGAVWTKLVADELSPEQLIDSYKQLFPQNKVIPLVFGLCDYVIRECNDYTYDAAKKYGKQCVVLSADVKRVDGVFRVFAKGGRENTGLDALEWIKRCADNGAGEIVLNSIDTDGVKKGFDLEMLAAVCEIVDVPVIASGGAGKIDDFITLFNTLPGVDAGLAASIFHFGEVKISDLKNAMMAAGIPTRKE